MGLHAAQTPRSLCLTSLHIPLLEPLRPQPSGEPRDPHMRQGCSTSLGPLSPRVSFALSCTPDHSGGQRAEPKPSAA